MTTLTTSADPAAEPSTEHEHDTHATPMAPTPEPSGVTGGPVGDGDDDDGDAQQQLINKIVPIVGAVVIIVIIILIYYLCYKKKKCTHQNVERGERDSMPAHDAPGDIGYYHNKGYTTEKPDAAENGGKNGNSWVNQRNGVETIPYNVASPPDKNSNTRDGDDGGDDATPGVSSNIPPGYVAVSEEERRQNQPMMD